MIRVIVLLSSLLVSACSTTPALPPFKHDYSGQGDRQIYIVGHGWHTGWVIPAKEIYQQIPALQDRFGNADYIEIGWGDLEFYQAKDITVELILQAILWPTETVVHAVAVDGDVHTYFSRNEVVRLCVNEQELSSLLQFVSNSFARDNAGQVQPMQRGIYGNSQFYQGQGKYHLFNTCNNWTAKGLKSLGMDINYSFKLTTSSILNFAQRYSLPVGSSCNSPNQE